jgi:hypothetical protein
VLSFPRDSAQAYAREARHVFAPAGEALNASREEPSAAAVARPGRSWRKWRRIQTVVPALQVYPTSLRARAAVLHSNHSADGRRRASRRRDPRI